MKEIIQPNKSSPLLAKIEVPPEKRETRSSTEASRKRA